MCDDQNQRIRFCIAWKKENDVDVLNWLSQLPDANHKKCLDTNEVQAPGKAHLESQAVSTDFDVFVPKLCYEIRSRLPDPARARFKTA